MNALSPMGDFALTFEPAYRQLQPMERVFVDNFVADIEHTAEQTGQRLLAVLNSPKPVDLDQRTRAMLARPIVRAAIVDRIRELSEIMEVSNYRTVKELKSLAYSNIGDYMVIGEDGKPSLDMSKCTREQLAAVQSIEIEDNVRTFTRKIKFKLHDKLGSIKTLMEYQGLLGAHTDHFQKSLEAEKPVDQLPADVSEETAAEAYSRVING
jgi:hypothetical protein